MVDSNKFYFFSCNTFDYFIDSVALEVHFPSLWKNKLDTWHIWIWTFGTCCFKITIYIVVFDNNVYSNFTANQIEDILNRFSKIWPTYIWFWKGCWNAKCDVICHYWTGLTIANFYNLFNILPALTFNRPNYCSCIVGNRTLGCCCHVMTVIWYLGWARHQNTLSAPASFLDNVLVRLTE